MKFYKLGLLTLLISLFILSSCKNQDEIGLGVDPGNQLNGSMIVDSSMTVATIPDDTVATVGLSRSALSYFNDPVFGVTQSDIAASLSLPGRTAYTIPTGVLSIDSAMLILPYAAGFYGDSLTSRFKLNVHQLQEQVKASTTYFSNKTWSYNQDVIGTKIFTARPNDSVRVYNIVAGKADTLVRLVPQVRVPMNTAFIYNNLFEGDNNLKSDAIFQNAFKGLFITLNKNQTTGPGGNIMLNMDSARIAVYYKSRNSTSGVVDTAMVTMPVTPTQHAVNIKHTYSSTIQAAISNPTASNNFYLQGLAGLRGKITFPNIKNVVAGLGNVVLNRVELVVKVAPGTNIPYAPASKLTLYQLDIAGQRALLPDANTADTRGANALSAFGGYYMKSTGEYHFTVTAYIQDLIRDRAKDYGLYIAPVNPTISTTAIDIAATPSYAERSVIAGKNSSNRIRLNITYTKINRKTIAAFNCLLIKRWQPLYFFVLPRHRI
ncbi:DUF4270 domain-containing protein [Mucilaginibacter pallidiroseus]|uniref:DUF4270 domain-containing protein n=1 Tax=Mucilaginibacter pallidiroseus TaxID=2599295 RepID=A0A563UFJ0_9SPHI|nr:DUF4270 domain-containing protein [Mucilaginibacter pallidiroseus]TWR30029.1 DUF4270 domain-containing protein [Mucilaginibacter pallidiroseus]